MFEGLVELAEITDSMANFAPCPEIPFNILKGILPDVCDFLNLMIDKIQLCVDLNIGLECKNYKGIIYAADAIRVKEWHKWFIDNRENYFMKEYYCIDGNNLIGRPMFITQSLCNPLPHTEKEVQECINSVVKIIKSRGRLMNTICCGEKT